LNAGAGSDSAEVHQLTVDLASLHELTAVPERDLVLSVLDERQKAMFTDFEKRLQLARQAIELGLLHASGIEDLCN
jgi:hypothetical protein